MLTGKDPVNGLVWGINIPTKERNIEIIGYSRTWYRDREEGG
nr:MAG TPA: hypothetical protein [Caudoviricetes sp.]